MYDKFQYRRRYREGYNSSNPMSSQLRIGCFNTEDGIGRATTRVRSRKMAQTSEFQYRRRYREGYNLRERNEDWRKECRFNTEDGIGRATTLCCNERYRCQELVSIPKTVSGGLQHSQHSSANLAWGFQYRRRYREGYNYRVRIASALLGHKFQYRRRYREGYNALVANAASNFAKFQYRRRYREGYNTVPLSPWGYWPQMSKMENLCDFPAFSSLRQQALFAFCAVTISETLTLQGFAVFGKKLENLRPF